MSYGIHWFRNDLRVGDNTALRALAQRSSAWLPVFVFDPHLLAGAGPARVHFLLDCLARLHGELAKRGTPLQIRRGRPEEVLPKLLQETGARVLSFNEDTTPYARARDEAVRCAVGAVGGETLTRLDRVVFAAAELRTRAGKPYAVYTPYKKAWRKRWSESPRMPQRGGRLPPAIPGFSADRLPTARTLGVSSPGPASLPTGGETAARRRLVQFLDKRVARYHEDRDFPAIDGTSRLSAHLRFGTISVRHCFEYAEDAAASDRRLRRGVDKWLDELVWREFYSAILEENPHVLRRSHRSEYDALAWNDDPAALEAWREGRTGFPIVDAGMRQLRETGWMHNRVRMIVASFLTKDLLLDWRLGAQHFFEALVDGDPASNNGGWQWAASTGTDPQPYFRIFNPTAQGERWDPKGRYVRRWVPELRGIPDRWIHSPASAERPPKRYPEPIVDHAIRRELALSRYRAARAGGEKR